MLQRYTVSVLPDQAVIRCVQAQSGINLWLECTGSDNITKYCRLGEGTSGRRCRSRCQWCILWCQENRRVKHRHGSLWTKMWCTLIDAERGRWRSMYHAAEFEEVSLFERKEGLKIDSEPNTWALNEHVVHSAFEATTASTSFQVYPRVTRPFVCQNHALSNWYLLPA